MSKLTNATVTADSSYQINTRLRKNTQVVKCQLCDSLESLKSFKHSYICEDCIDYVKNTSTND